MVGTYIPTVCAAPKSTQVRFASEPAELRAAAYLRASSFLNIPSDRSDFARRSHLQMTADDAWSQLEEGLKIGNERKLTFLPMIVTQMHPEGVEDVISKGIQIQIPTNTAPEFVVGTLDITIGPKLPAEELIGRMPEDGQRRAYLSNVCVLESVRRQGIARQMINAACEKAKECHVECMYVHVIESNTSARKLYEARCGFDIEQEENAGIARALNRPKRLLLRRSLSKS